MIDITGMDKADVLAALYNASRPQGMGYLHYTPTPMTKEEAAELLGGKTTECHTSGYRSPTYFDYLNGRVMKVDLSKDQFDERLYDRDNGNGAASRALEKVMKR